eukprot:gene10443-5775_t
MPTVFVRDAAAGGAPPLAVDVRPDATPLADAGVGGEATVLARWGALDADALRDSSPDELREHCARRGRCIAWLVLAGAADPAVCGLDPGLKREAVRLAPPARHPGRVATADPAGLKPTIGVDCETCGRTELFSIHNASEATEYG